MGCDPSEVKGALAITALDVGQGDALLIDFPDKSVGLVDGGGFALGVPDVAERVLLPVLRARRVESIRLMVLTHAHPDHLGGLVGVARNLPVERLWHAATEPRHGSDYWELLDRVRKGGGRIQGPGELCGQGEVPFSGVRVRVLWPCGPALTAAGTERWGLNDRSLVVSLAHGEHTALLAGDLERPGELALLQHANEVGWQSWLAADLLKVAHHGSDTSTTDAFLRRVRPQLALVSAGVRNRFDHPRPTTLARLRAFGIPLYRTDRHGSITWIADARGQRVRAADPCGLDCITPGRLSSLP